MQHLQAFRCAIRLFFMDALQIFGFYCRNILCYMSMTVQRYKHFVVLSAILYLGVSIVKTTKFGERLGELMFQKNNVTSDQLGEAVGFGGSTIRLWREGKSSTLLSNAIVLADFFSCSLDFLFGRSDEIIDFIPKQPLGIYSGLKKIMKERKLSWYAVVKDAKIAKSNLYDWRDGRDPLMPTVIILADYLEVTLDYLVGREQ